MKKRSLKKQIRFANADEKEGLLKICQDLKEKLNALSKAENLRRRRVKRRKEQEFLLQVPYEYARNIFDQPKSGVLKIEKICSGEILKKTKTYSDPNRHIHLEHDNNLVWLAIPKVRCNMKPPTREEIRRIVSKSRNKFTIGPNGIPFLLLKNLPKFSIGFMLT